MLSLGVWGGEFLLWLFQLLVVVWHSLTCGYITPNSVWPHCLPSCLSHRCLSYKDTCSLDLGLTWLGTDLDISGGSPHLKVFSLTTSAKTFFQINFHRFQELGYGHIFWWPQVNPLQVGSKYSYNHFKNDKNEAH